MQTQSNGAHSLTLGGKKEELYATLLTLKGLPGILQHG